MRYIWHDDLRRHHLSTALTAPTSLTAHLKVDVGREGKVEFGDEYRAGGSSSRNKSPDSMKSDGRNFYIRLGMTRGKRSQ